jgi:Domain of unknown function (DUF4288)
MKRRTRFYNLAEWRLGVSELARLGERRVRLHAYTNHPREAALFRLPPLARRAAIRRARAKQYRVVRAWWPNADYEPIGAVRAPMGIRGVLPARLVPRLSSLPVGDVWIDAIEGRTRRQRPVAVRLFAVQARFAIQIESQVRGIQDYEDRIVVVSARTEDEAVRKLRRPFAAYGRPYLNPGGFMVRWVFERILGVYATYVTEVDPTGTEVFSQIRCRRMRSEHVWRRPTRG